jgi:hypothetical protein
MFYTIVDRKITKVLGTATYDIMSDTVGGLITTLTRVDSPIRKGVEIDAYVNDEGLLIDLPIDHILLPYKSPIAGNIFITASNEDGATIPMVDLEINAMLPFIGRLPMTLSPIDFGF